MDTTEKRSDWVLTGSDRIFRAGELNDPKQIEMERTTSEQLVYCDM